MFWNDMDYDDLIKKDKYEKVAYDGESEIWYNTTDEFFIVANKFLPKSTPLRYVFEFIDDNYCPWNYMILKNKGVDDSGDGELYAYEVYLTDGEYMINKIRNGWA